jgi:hypothetical protein
MKVTLLDEQGVQLTEITSHVGRSRGQMLVDWATRPDALFQYYFDRGRRTVSLGNNAERYSAVLGTRWQMGARFWFLHTFHLVRAPAQAAGQTRSTRDSAPVASDTRRPDVVRPAADLDAPTVARTSEPRGVPA